VNVDLSQFDSITDRVARAKAKADAIKNAKASGESGDAKASADTAATAAEAIQEGAEVEAKVGLAILEFKAGMHFKWRGRAARTVGIRYDLVSFVYDDEPDQMVTADRYRLSHEHAEGELVFARKSEAYRPQRVASFNRVSYHDYLWHEGHSGMTAKKRRPRTIAIINPDYCTGCNACIEVCPTDCIEEVDVAEAGLDGYGKFYDVRLADCIGCIQCVKECPWEAIEMVDTDKVEEAYELPAGSL
jgi:NAD-dependent dihydropyrimidine dehydrogenase PreA subunit